MRTVVFVLALVFGGAVFGAEADLRLKDGPGKEAVIANCSSCHSLDYIPMNSPFVDRAGWEKTVHKMIAVMGAPVTENDARTIIDYLTRHYGK